MGPKQYKSLIQMFLRFVSKYYNMDLWSFQYNSLSLISIVYK
jgi:hypothetical protein